MCLGIPGRIVDVVDRDEHRAVVDVDGVRREINVGLLELDDDGVQEGDWVLIHVGFALAKIDEDEAARTLELVREMEAWDEEMSAFGESGP